MLTRHVSRQLSAFLDGQLSSRDAQLVGAHLETCAACRNTLDRIRFASAVVRQLTVMEAPPSVWTSIETARLDRQTAPEWRWLTIPRLAAVAVVLVAMMASGIWLVNLRRENRWERLAADGAGRRGTFQEGEWLETSAGSRARLRVGTIGTVDVEPNSRVRLETARRNEHRLSLARGTISARISAPPRVFFVNTAASTVVDLGCAYTIQADEVGVGVLRVTEGWASLEWGGRESLVPAGALCRTRPSLGPGCERAMSGASPSTSW